ncbi:AfsR/SARP family transcriptional regulator [Actinomadura scrupuli]|uniref:AfsR/SARP family transcriptional regulator n=1 Tax=Actinomadura scrupuli TaxID=559629 RepID=UPI003D9A09A8
MALKRVRFRLLKEVTAESGGHEVFLGHPRERLLLAILLIADGTPLTVDRLVDRFWLPHDPPDTARELIREYMKKLRGRLTAVGASDLIPRGAGGYRVDVPREDVDLHRFHDGLRHARAASDPRAAISHYRAALAEWGDGPRTGDEALAGLPGEWAATTRQALAEDHHAARIACLELELGLGEHQRLIPELYRAVEQGPVDEKFAELLMLALYRAGRTADALEAFERVRLRLDEQIEAPPGHTLTDLHRRIQWDDPALRLPESAPGVQMTNDPAALATDAAELVAAGSRPGAAVPAAGRLVETLEGRLVEPAERAALAWVRDSPDDPEAVASLAARLLRLLSEDAEFTRQVARLVDQAAPIEYGKASVRADTIEKLTIFQEKVQISGDMNF